MKFHALTTIILLMLSGAASAAAEYPTIKPGLWQTTEKGDNPRRFSVCFGDAASQHQMLAHQQMAMKKICSKKETRKEGDKWTSDSVCNYYPAGTHIIKHGVTTMNGDATHTDLVTSFDPPSQDRKNSTTTSDSKWTGPCKAGQKPGDTVIEK